MAALRCGRYALPMETDARPAEFDPRSAVQDRHLYLTSDRQWARRKGRSCSGSSDSWRSRSSSWWRAPTCSCPGPTGIA